MAKNKTWPQKVVLTVFFKMVFTELNNSHYFKSYSNFPDGYVMQTYGSVKVCSPLFQYFENDFKTYLLLQF